MHGGPFPLTASKTQGEWGPTQGHKGTRVPEVGFCSPCPRPEHAHGRVHLLATSDSKLSLGKRPHQLWVLPSVSCLWDGGAAHRGGSAHMRGGTVAVPEDSAVSRGAVGQQGDGEATQKMGTRAHTEQLRWNNLGPF